MQIFQGQLNLPRTSSPGKVRRKTVKCDSQSDKSVTEKPKRTKSLTLNIPKTSFSGDENIQWLNSVLNSNLIDISTKTPSPIREKSIENELSKTSILEKEKHKVKRRIKRKVPDLKINFIYDSDNQTLVNSLGHCENSEMTDSHKSCGNTDTSSVNEEKNGLLSEAPVLRDETLEVRIPSIHIDKHQ